MRRRLSLGPFVAMIVVSNSVLEVCAVEKSAQYRYELIYSDNVALAETNPQSELIHTLSNDLIWEKRTDKLEARFVSTVQYRQFQHQTSPNDLLINFNGVANYVIVPERFTWVVEENVSPTLINRRAAPTPDNIQLANILLTGPDLTFRLTPKNRLVFGGRYTNFYFQEVDLDNQRYQSSARWIYRKSANTEFSANYENEYVDFNNEVVNTNFTRQSTYLRTDTRPAGGALVLDAGVTKIQRVSLDTQGMLARLLWRRDMGPRSSVSLSIADELYDAGQDLQSQTEEDSITSPSGTVITSDIYRTRSRELAYTFRSSSTRTAIGIFDIEDDYELLALDERRRGADINIGVSFNARVQGVVLGEYTEIDYLNIDRMDKFTTIGFSVIWRGSKNLNYSTGVQRRILASVGADSATGYTENQLLFGLIYNRSTGALRARDLSRMR